MQQNKFKFYMYSIPLFFAVIMTSALTAYLIAGRFSMDAITAFVSPGRMIFISIVNLTASILISRYIFKMKKRKADQGN